jgi:probable phosphoglycerate mutase
VSDGSGGQGGGAAASTPIPQPGLFPTGTFVTEVLLIRHGRSDDVVPGSPESYDPPLHPEGVAQAAALGRRLAPKKIDAVYSSDLARAVQTAAPISDPRGYTTVQRADLREVHLGDWEGGEFRRLAAAGDPQWLAWAATGRWDGVPNGEGDDAFRARVRGAIDDIAAANEGAAVAVVCHGGVINAFLASLSESRRSFIATIDNTSVSVVRYGGPSVAVLTVNDCHHIYDHVLGAALGQ